jgi:hypothetical protein
MAVRGEDSRIRGERCRVAPPIFHNDVLTAILLHGGMMSFHNDERKRAMADLKDLEKRLNSDPELREQFLKNPSRILKEEGLPLTAAQNKELKEELARTKTAPPTGRGAAGAKAKIRISIKISVGTNAS